MAAKRGGASGPVSELPISPEPHFQDFGGSVLDAPSRSALVVTSYPDQEGIAIRTQLVGISAARCAITSAGVFGLSLEHDPRP